MTVYFDSSALLPIYVPEALSPRARREARRSGQIPFTPLHDLEVRNALRNLAGRKLINAAELHGSLTQVDEDLETRRLLHAPLDFSRVFDRSLELSARYTQKLLCRSLDILHVAAALELRANRLISADERQLALARAVGIATVDIKKGR